MDKHVTVARSAVRPGDKQGPYCARGSITLPKQSRLNHLGNVDLLSKEDAPCQCAKAVSHTTAGLLLLIFETNSAFNGVLSACQNLKTFNQLLDGREASNADNAVLYAAYLDALAIYKGSEIQLSDFITLKLDCKGGPRCVKAQQLIRALNILTHLNEKVDHIIQQLGMSEEVKN